MVAGVARGLADHLYVSVGVVRVGFVLLTAIGGFGLLLYAGLWLAVPAGENEGMPGGGESVGQQAASRLGMRPTRLGEVTSTSAGLVVALALVALGAVLLLDLSVGSSSLWPFVVLAAGAALVWQQAEARDSSAAGVLRVASGSFVVGLGVFFVIAGRGDLGQLVDALFVLLVVGLGIAIVVGPWLLQLYRDLTRERRERIRSQERADVAAHLHDSVLQTLAVIQRRADEPEEVLRLARSQERDLRRWLYGDQVGDAAALGPALHDMVAWVEDTYGIAVELVVVGDSPASIATDAMLAALREGLVNAAKHSGARSASVFVEVEGERMEGYVRDRGEGFVLADVPEDRRGVRGSIVERVERRGGEAVVTSEPGVGTQVHVSFPGRSS